MPRQGEERRESKPKFPNPADTDQGRINRTSIRAIQTIWNEVLRQREEVTRLTGRVHSLENVVNG